VIRTRDSRTAQATNILGSDHEACDPVFTGFLYRSGRVAVKQHGIPESQDSATGRLLYATGTVLETPILKTNPEHQW
jgi:hypothetical protein